MSNVRRQVRNPYEPPKSPVAEIEGGQRSKPRVVTLVVIAAYVVATITAISFLQLFDPLEHERQSNFFQSVWSRATVLVICVCVVVLVRRRSRLGRLSGLLLIGCLGLPVFTSFVPLGASGKSLVVLVWDAGLLVALAALGYGAFVLAFDAKVRAYFSRSTG